MNSVDQQEIENFSKDSAFWWDEDGAFAPLHRMNPVRLSYIRDQILTHFQIEQTNFTPLDGISVLDIGCGGGLICEPLSRLGGSVTGIDADAQAIDVAKKHASQGGLNIQYVNGSIEDHTARYDVILALEIVEHVNQPNIFIQNCSKSLKPGGLMIVSTLNRTAKSYALGILAAEYILRWVPQGTHQWKKFMKPSEVSGALRRGGLETRDLTGLVYNPASKEFSLSKTDIAVNYFVSAAKEKK